MIMPRVVPDQRNKFYTDELFKKLSRETELIEVTNDYLILLSSKNYYAISPPSFSLPRKKLDMRYLRCSGHYGDAIDYRDMSSSHAIKYRCRKTVRYTGYRDRPMEERRSLFRSDIINGHAEMAYPSAGINIPLTFVSNAWSEQNVDRIPTPEFVDLLRQQGKVFLKSQFILNGVSIVWTGCIDLLKLEGIGRLHFDQSRASIEESMMRLSTDEERIPLENTYVPGTHYEEPTHQLNSSLFGGSSPDNESMVHFPPFSPS